jgi:hypothetical protein
MKQLPLSILLLIQLAPSLIGQVTKVDIKPRRHLLDSTPKVINTKKPTSFKAKPRRSGSTQNPTPAENFFGEKSAASWVVRFTARDDCGADASIYTLRVNEQHLERTLSVKCARDFRGRIDDQKALEFIYTTAYPIEKSVYLGEFKLDDKGMAYNETCRLVNVSNKTPRLVECDGREIGKTPVNNK